MRLRTNLSLNVSITIDNNVANASIVTPTNDTTQTGNFLINASVNDSGTGVQTSAYRLMTAEGSVTAWVYAVLNSGTIDQGYWSLTFDSSTVEDGVYNITINATDFVGNQNIVNISTIILDIEPANATVIQPIAKANVSGDLFVNASVNDSGATVDQVNVTLFNNTANVTGLIPMSLGAGTTNFGYWNTVSIKDGDYNISVNATNTNDNVNISENLSIVIDNSVANISSVVPTNGTIQTGTLLINASVNDSPTKVFNATFRIISPSSDTGWLYAELNSGDIGQGYWNTSYDTTTLQNGRYNITINATDFAGNQNILNISRILIDNTATSQCGELLTNDQTYTLTASLSDTNTCFTIKAPGITLDCGGFTITYATSSEGNGVDIQANSTTIQNCVFSQHSARTYSPAIYATNSNNSIILNNTVNVTGADTYGIELRHSNFTNITNNVINTSGSNAYGMALVVSGKNNLTQNNILTRGGTHAYGINLTNSSSNIILGNNVTTDGTLDFNYGIYLTGSIYNNITSNTVSTDGTNNNYGIHLLSSSTTNTIANNKIDTDGTSFSNYGIFVKTSTKNNLTNNNITTNGEFCCQYGIIITTGDGNIISNNNISTDGIGTSSNYGIRLTSNTHNSMLKNNHITTDGTDNNQGILIDQTANNNTLINNIIIADSTGTNNHGITFNNANNNRVINSSITAAAGSDIRIGSTSLQKNFIINTTYDRTDISWNAATAGAVYNLYFLTVNVTDTNGNTISGASVNISSEHNRTANVVNDVIVGSC